MLPRSAAEGGNSSNRIAASIASGLKCMYRCVVPRSRWPASFCTAGAGAPRIERCEQNVRRNKRSRVPRLVTGCEPCLARRALEQVREHVTRDMDLTGTAGHAALSKTGSRLGEARISEVPVRVMPLSTATALTSSPGRRCRCARPRPWPRRRRAASGALTGP